MTSKDDVIRGQEWAGLALVRENERLRAEIEQLKLITDWAAVDELRADVERLRTQIEELKESRQRYMDIATGVTQFDFIEKDAEIERLRAEIEELWTGLEEHHPLMAEELLCPICTRLDRPKE